MLFESSLRRELARSFGAALVVLLTVVITMMLVRALSQASRGEFDPQDVLLFLTYAVLTQLAPLLTMAVFIAVAAVLSRMYRDSEMVIWHVSGIGLSRFVAPVARFALPIWAVIALLTAFVAPWANQQRDEMRLRYEQRGDLERVAPGQFQESSGGRRVLYIDRNEQDDGQGRNVFILSVERDGSESVLSARAGQVVTRDGVAYLVLRDGQRVLRTGAGAESAAQVSEFDTYWVQVRSAEAAPGASGRQSARTTWELLRDGSPSSRGELSWRAGLVLSAINLALLAIAVSAANPRAGKSGNLMFMLFAFLLYHNLLTMGESWIARGRVGMGTFMLLLHGGVALGVLLWLAQREQPWLQRWRRRPEAA